MAKGGARVGAGRKKGSPNKATAEIKSLAQTYGPEALKILIKIMRDKDVPAKTRTAAANSVLDRAYGKAALSITGADDRPLFPTDIKITIV